LCNCKKNKQEHHGLGRSCGGFSTKIHGVCDALGMPIHFTITPGQTSDYTQAIHCISGFTFKALLADKGYDSNAFRQHIEGKGSIPVIPARKNRIEPVQHDRHLYKERHKIECLFGFLKHYRRLFARFDKSVVKFKGFLHFVASLQWLK